MRSIFLLFLFISQFFISQTLSSNLSKSTIALGEVNVLKITVSNLNREDVIAAPRNELLPFHFEEIKDEVEKTDDSYTRTIEFTIFEEGKYTVPPLEISVGGVVQKTIPYEVEVINTAKKGDEINDIMANKEVKLGIGDYWNLYKFYILLALILIAIIILIWALVKYFRRRAVVAKRPANQVLVALEKLRKKKYIENGEYRPFYVELIDLTRHFLTRQYNIPADVLLTEDLIDYMKKSDKISAENEKSVEEVFLRGDLVKFAKTIPDRELMEQDFNQIKEFVKRSYQDEEFEKLRKDV